MIRYVCAVCVFERVCASDDTARVSDEAILMIPAMIRNDDDAASDVSETILIRHDIIDTSDDDTARACVAESIRSDRAMCVRACETLQTCA
jgi:hypothetical protein